MLLPAHRSVAPAERLYIYRLAFERGRLWAYIAVILGNIMFGDMYTRTYIYTDMETAILTYLM